MQNGLSARRLLCYTAGMIILAIGLTLTAQSGLGTSPLTSIAFVLGKCLDMRFSDTTLIMFSVFVIIQIILEKKKTPAAISKLLLQIPLSILFTRVMGLIQRLIDLTGAALPLRIFVLILAVILTGIGAALTLYTNLIPNPGDGIVKALACSVAKPLGRVKNVFDIANVTAAALISLIVLGRLEGVGIGSVIAMLGVGRVIALCNLLLKGKKGQEKQYQTDLARS